MQTGPGDRAAGPSARALSDWVDGLERVGRLVAHGRLTRPEGDLVILRARDSAEAERALRGDPFREIPDSRYELLEWAPRTRARGVSLEPPPPLGSGRLTQVQRVTVAVRDRRKSQAWYCSVLGLRTLVDDRETGHLELGLGEGAVALSLVEPAPEWGEPHYTEALTRIGRATGVVFETDSVPALELRLRHAGATLTEGPRQEPWGGTTLRFEDPDGNEFLAFERPRRPGRRAGSPGAVPPRRTGYIGPAGARRGRLPHG